MLVIQGADILQITLWEIWSLGAYAYSEEKEEEKEGLWINKNRAASATRF